MADLRCAIGANLAATNISHSDAAEKFEFRDAFAMQGFPCLSALEFAQSGVCKSLGW